MSDMTEENAKVAAERLKQIETAILRLAQAQEAASKINGEQATKITNTSAENKVEAVTEAGSTISKALSGNPAEILEQTLNALAKGIEGIIQSISKSAESLTSAKLTTPIEDIKRFGREAAMSGSPLSMQQVREMRSQIAPGYVAADKFSKDVDTEFAGSGAAGYYTRTITGSNLVQEWTRAKRNVGDWWSREIQTKELDAREQEDIENKKQMYNSNFTGGR